MGKGLVVPDKVLPSLGHIKLGCLQITCGWYDVQVGDVRPQDFTENINSNRTFTERYNSPIESTYKTTEEVLKNGEPDKRGPLSVAGNPSQC